MKVQMLCKTGIWQNRCALVNNSFKVIGLHRLELTYQSFFFSFCNWHSKEQYDFLKFPSLLAEIFVQPTYGRITFSNKPGRLEIDRCTINLFQINCAMACMFFLDASFLYSKLNYEKRQCILLRRLNSDKKWIEYDLTSEIQTREISSIFCIS